MSLFYSTICEGWAHTQSVQLEPAASHTQVQGREPRGNRFIGIFMMLHPSQAGSRTCAGALISRAGLRAGKPHAAATMIGAKSVIMDLYSLVTELARCSGSSGFALERVHRVSELPLPGTERQPAISYHCNASVCNQKLRVATGELQRCI